jgi:WD40 repeat protein
MLVLKTKYQKLSRVAFAPDGRGLAAAGKYGVYSWRSVFDDPKPVKFGDKECGGAGFASDGAHLIALFRDVGLSAINLADGSQRVAKAGEWGSTLTVCPATGLAVVETWCGGTMSGWRVGAGGSPERVWGLDAEPGSIGSSAAFAGDGSWFVRAARNPAHFPVYQIMTHDPATGREIGMSPGWEWLSCGPAVSPDGKWIAFGCAGFLVARRAANPKLVKTTQNENTHQFTGIAYHPSGRYLAATNNDRTVKLYDTTSWQVAKTFTWDIGRMRSVAFSPDGTLAAAGSDSGKVVVWDVDV